MKYNAQRYANDLGLVYETLIKVLNYIQENICILYADGQNINYLGNQIRTEKASLERLKRCFSAYQKELTSDDEFFFVVSNHGGNQENGVIYLWGEKEYITLDAITEYLAQLPCKKIVILGQCFSGNILEYEHQNTIMITANKKDLPSYGMFDYVEVKKGEDIFNCNYDEFLYHFFSYLQFTYKDTESSAKTPDTEKLKHAFNYAYKQDRYNPEHINYEKLCKRIGSTIYEIPQYREYS